MGAKGEGRTNKIQYPKNGPQKNNKHVKEEGNKREASEKERMQQRGTGSQIKGIRLLIRP